MRSVAYLHGVAGVEPLRVIRVSSFVVRRVVRRLSCVVRRVSSRGSWIVGGGSWVVSMGSGIGMRQCRARRLVVAGHGN